MNKNTLRIGLFGGSFDPVHNGHLELAEKSRRDFNLDKVIFIPARVPPHKKYRRLTPHTHRISMIRAAIKPFPKFYLSMFELKRKTTTYTYQTVMYFKKRFPAASLFFIMGSDSLSEIHTWERSKELAGLCEFIVGKRKETSQKTHAFIKHHINSIKKPVRAVSSSDIRRRIAAGKPIGRLVPKAVNQYISKHELYCHNQLS